MSWQKKHLLGDEMLSDIVEERLGPRECATCDLDCTSLCLKAITNVLFFFCFFHKRFRWQTLCSDCGTDGKWARVLGGSLAHAMNTLLGLVSVVARALIVVP